MKMKHKAIYMLVAVSLMFGACNDAWEEEQYEQYVSFKAPASDQTVTRVRVKYHEEGTLYQLPLLVSGTTVNGQNLDVHVGVDNDTLQIYNMEHFGEENEYLWFRQLSDARYLFNPVTRIPAGESSALIDIQLDFSGLDLSDNWVLPLIVEDDLSYGYQSNLRLGYNNALLWFTPFNDYSGTYQATSLNVTANNNSNRLPIETRSAYVVDENSVFFYAGAIDESREDRKLFKIKATFHEDETFIPESGSEIQRQGTVELAAMNNVANLNFTVTGTPTYVVRERMDSETPTTMIRTVVISGLSYAFNDPKKIAGQNIPYEVSGTMSLERRINTTIPDEEFAIEWDD